MAPRVDLPQGTLDLLILKAIALDPQHGWAISERIQQISKDVLRVQQGSLYPALHRLERRGWIKATWHVREQSPRQVLRADPRRPQAARHADRRVARADNGREPPARHAVIGGRGC